MRTNAYTGNSIYHITGPDYFISLRVTSLALWQAHFDGLAQGCSNSSALHKAIDSIALVRGRQSPRIIDRWLLLLMLIDLGCVWQMDREWQTHTMCRLRVSPKCNKSDFYTFYCKDHKITEFGITDKNSSTAYIVLYKWIDTWFLDSNRRVGVWSLPWRWHILSIPLTTGRGTSAETCGLDDVFPPDDLGSRPETLC